jgi:hypothetical protein
MNLEKTEARNDCAVEDQQQFNRPTAAVSQSMEWNQLVGE